MTPAAPSTARVVAFWTRERKVPERMRNSPTKPLVPGRPMEESVTTTKAVAIQGTCLARPPYSAMTRVWRRS